MSDKAEKNRVSVTLTGPYVEALDKLVEEGLYMDPQDVMRDALRQFLRFHRIEPFIPKLVEEAKDSSGR